MRNIFMSNSSVVLDGCSVVNRGTEIASKINARDISAVEYVTAVLKLAKHSPINAFTYLREEEALLEAERLDYDIQHGQTYPLAGVPVGLKDFLPSKKGWPSSHGGVPCMSSIDDADSEFYKAARSLGAIAIGKTNAPAFGFRGTTDNKMYGATSNPYDYNMNSGGSSGGSAAAVGAGIIPLAEGGDAGGSIRIPASWCGCFGYKPSAGLVPSVCRPDAWAATHPYCCSGPIASDVNTAAIVADSMIYHNPRDPLSVPVKPDICRAAADPYRVYKHKGGLRVGITLNFGMFPAPDPVIAETVVKAGEFLERESGGDIRVGTAKFGLSKDMRHEIEESWLRSISIDSALDLELMKRSGKDYLADHPEDFPKEFIHWQKVALESTMMDYRRFHDLRTLILDAHLDVFDKFDVILAPVSGCMPVLNTNDTQGPSIISGEGVNPLIGFGYTYLENMTGFPAASVPFDLDRGTKTPMPIGIQVIAPRYRDDLVFAVSRLLEKHTEGDD